MKVNIHKATLGGSIKAIASKSHAHRMLICAALSEQPCHILCSETSEDILATADCLRALGAKITRTEDGFAVIPIVRGTVSEATLHCRESGSTLRFMLPIVCALGGSYGLYGEGRLPQRPLSPLYEQLQAHGMTLSEQGSVPLTVSGQLMGGQYTLPGNVSSQFVSGLLFALPLLAEDSCLELTGKVESLPYIHMTLQALAQAGIRIGQQGQTFHIPGGQRYGAPANCEVEGDWSNAAFWLCAGALTPAGITVTNLDPDSLQGDKQVLEILARFGAEVTSAAPGSYTVRGGELRGITVDAGNIPDLVPVLAAVACGAVGETVFTHAERLRIKESDRLQTVYTVLSTLGGTIEITADGLKIQGGRPLQGGCVQAYGDHRIAMTAAVAACLCQGPLCIEGAEAVAKSYPAFFTHYAGLGGRIEEDV